ncbi:MAG: hypothetical protein HQL73_02040 [Magnetococcales bacterium]|nr:hypothetical protein [Magnetococcales bacterium]
MKQGHPMSRRFFLKSSLAAGTILPTVLGMLPHPVGGRALAQSEKGVGQGWLELAARRGEPTGKFGKIGDPVTLTVGYQPYCTPYWTSTVNKQAQLWAQYLPKGSRVLWFRSLSGPLIGNNMNAGSNQFGYMAETPALRAGDIVACDMVSVTGYDSGETGAIVVRRDLWDEKKVAAPVDLKGKPVGTPFGSYSHRQCLTWMEQNKIDLDLLDRSIELQMSQLKQGTLWASALWEPYPSWMEYRHLVKRWISGLEMPCTCTTTNKEATPHTFRVVGATLAVQDWIRERPDIIAAYLKSEEESRDLLTHAPDLAAYYIWSDIPEVPPPVIRSSLDMMVWDGRITAAIRTHLQGCARLWRAHGQLQHERSQNPDAYVDEWANGGFLDLAIGEMQQERRWTSATQPGFPKLMNDGQRQRHEWSRYADIQVRQVPWSPTRL